jgi:hypothetical protein
MSIIFKCAAPRNGVVRAFPTAMPKHLRGKLIAGLSRGRTRALLQRARKNAAAPKTFAPRALCAILRGKLVAPAAARTI